jgi:hypothetical protein
MTITRSGRKITRDPLEKKNAFFRFHASERDASPFGARLAG